jgi:hypothetical protein
MHILILPIPFLLLFRVRCVDCVIDNPMANLDACLKALTCSPHLNLNTRVSRLSTKFHGLLLLAVKLVPPSQAFRDQRGHCTKLEPLRWAGTVPHRNRTQKLPRHRPSASSKKATFPAFTAATRHGARCFVMAMSLRSLPRAPLALRSCRVGAIQRSVGVGRLTQKRWASNDKKSGDEERPFYFQLQESIYERVQKEKAEQYRIQSLQQRTARGQFWATVTGTHIHRVGE